MTKSSGVPAQPPSGTDQTEATDKPAALRRSDAQSQWMTRILTGAKRMHNDKAFREEIEKQIS